jgi:hypothetical protein
LLNDERFSPGEFSLSDEFLETWLAPRVEKVGATEGGLSCLPAFPYDVAPQKPNARGSHSFLARPPDETVTDGYLNLREDVQ